MCLEIAEAICFALFKYEIETKFRSCPSTATFEKSLLFEFLYYFEEKLDRGQEL